MNEMEIEKGFVFFNIYGKFTTPLIIKSNNIVDPDSPDTASIMNSYNDYIIPGSSLKGTLRSRIEVIANYYSLNDELDELFGKINIDNKSQFKLSRLFANESTLNNANPKIYSKNRIDRFTSGTINNALMNDEPVTAETEISLIYRKTNNISYDNMVVGLISLALRDLGTENLNLGADFSIGRGRFKAHKMFIRDEHQNIEIDFKNKTISNKNLLDEYISAIKNYNVRG
jgi:CRISPR/Cas system CSM-associated protein Csm3 (group 7 of RAMP superfamily)